MTDIHTSFVFDWDDSLFPTTYLFKQFKCSTFDDIKRLQESLRYDELKNFHDTDNIAYNLLLESCKMDVVFILTSSTFGWVEHTCKVFYPKTYTLLKNITIIHSKEFSAFESGKKAKAHVFDTLIFKRPKLLQVIAVGNTIHDRYAVLHTGEKYPHIRKKSIMLTKAGNTDIQHQLKNCIDNLYHIYTDPNDLDLTTIVYSYLEREDTEKDSCYE